MVQVSVILPARNEVRLAATLRGLATTPSGAAFEVVVIDDGSHPPADVGGGFGLALRQVRTAGEGAAAARNRGAAIATGDVLCFCDAHLDFRPGWLGTLVAALDAFDAVSPEIASPEGAAGYGCTWGPDFRIRWLARPQGRCEVPFLPGGCLTVRRSAFSRIGGFDAGLVPWGHEDTELSWALWRSGARLGVEPAAAVVHHFRARHPYLVLQDQVDHNLLRLGCIHFGASRLSRLVAHLRVPSATVAAVWREADERRRRLAALQCYDDDWLCERFHLTL